MNNGGFNAPQVGSDGLDRSGLRHVNRVPMRALSRPFTVDLDGEWDFRFEHEAPDAWRVVSVPSLWTLVEDEEHPHYTNVAMPFDDVMPQVPVNNPTGIYRRRVHSTRLEGQRCILRIGAAEGHLRVYVNSVPVGSSSDSHLAAEFEITHALVDNWNDIQLHVTKWSAASYLEDQDQWWLFGLARSVGLVLTPKVCITDVAANADWDGEFGDLEMHVTAEALTSATRSCHSVRIVLDEWQTVAHVEPRFEQPRLPRATNDRSVRPEARLPEGFRDLIDLTAANAPLPPELRALPMHMQTRSRPKLGAAGTALLKIPRCKVLSWSAETPHLYDVRVELLDEHETVIDAVVVRVGFRRVEIVGRDLLVNGARVLLQGVNRHDFDPNSGRVISRERLISELQLLKRHNFNAIRTAHYPTSPEFYDLCDEYGFYVVDEANIEGHAYASTIADRAEYLPEIVERVQRMVLRDRNHPCIILWSLGNETGYGAAHDAAAAWVRRVDASRPLHYEGAVAGDWHGGHASTDVVCPMYPSFLALEAFARDARADRPLIACEYAYSQGNSTGGLAEYWKLFESLPGLQGGFIWQFTDQSLDPAGSGQFRYGGDFGDTPNDGPTVLNGIVFSNLDPKPALLEARGVFSPIAVMPDFSLVAPTKIFIRNRLHFATLHEFEFHVRVETQNGSGVFVPLHVPETLPGQRVPVQLPMDIQVQVRASDALALTVRVTTIADKPWAPRGTEIALQQVQVPQARRELPSEGQPVAVDRTGDVQHPLLVASPRLCLWRAPVDNDLSFALDQRFVRSGFFALTPEDVQVDIVGHQTHVVVQYRAAFGDEVLHRRRIHRYGDEFIFDEQVTLPPNTQDGLRVGMEFELAPGLSYAEWVGLGPWENYPDRSTSALLGRWHRPIDDMPVPYLRPQSSGTRGGVTEMLLTGDGISVSARSNVPLHLTLSRHSTHELEEATHWWQLRKSARTIVHLDVAHRGVGTALLGPDTRLEHRLTGSTYAWTWALTLS